MLLKLPVQGFSGLENRVVLLRLCKDSRIRTTLLAVGLLSGSTCNMSKISCLHSEE